MFTVEQLTKMEPIRLLDYMLGEFPAIQEELPQVNCIRDMSLASNKMIELANIFSFLESAVAYFKVYVRDAKRNLPKNEYEDMIDRRDILVFLVDIVKQKHTALSRAVTIYIENNKEMQLANTKYC